jgi:1,4-dihydroxy-2-naphthoate octaprenyltransferase
MQLKLMLGALRLNTIPLSLSGIILGGSFAVYNNVYNANIFAAALMTAALLQIIANLANDYGDTLSGVDNTNRGGPQRIMQSGKISKEKMRQVIVGFVLVTITSGINLIYQVYQKHGQLSDSIILALLGLTALGAALKYTLGKKPYGYRALGDLSVFLFFGLLSVLGSYFLFSPFFEPQLILPAISIGLLSVSVLNINNIRDINTDKQANKRTLANIFGLHFAINYQFTLITIAALCAAIFVLSAALPIKAWMFIFALPALYGSAVMVKHYPDDAELLNFQLTKTALGSFAFAVLMAFGIVL